jgi:tetratricopeptide (TPR) repeat protein
MTEMTIDQAVQIAYQHQRAGRTADAETLYRQILLKEPNDARALYGLGLLALRIRHDDAIGLLSQALALAPNNAEGFMNLGVALQCKGHFDAAIDAYQKAIALDPNLAMSYTNLGVALEAKGRLEDARLCHIKALESGGEQVPEIHYNLGHVLQGMQRLAEAEIAYRRSIELRPNHPEALSNLGNVLRGMKRIDESIDCYHRAIVLRPNFAEPYNNLGNALFALNRIEESIEYYRRSIALKPDFVEAYSNLGNAMVSVGEMDQAIAYYRQGIATQPNFAKIHFHLALTQLLRGEYEEGWREYEWRWRVPEFPSPRRPFTQPQWNGSPPADPNQTLLIHAEQGLGDAIQFIRYLPLVIRRGWRVALECPPKLCRLAETSNLGTVAIVGTDPNAAAPDIPFDVHLPMASLPLVLGEFDPRRPTLPPGPYLHVADELTEIWRQRVAAVAAESDFKVGLAWAGSVTHINDHNRSMPLGALAPLARCGARLFSLQVGDGSQQAATPPPGMELIDLTGNITDFADTAALMMNLDLVICVDTAVAHLAGALGRPTWVLLPLRPDFRWLLDRPDSPLYPSLRLFRQVKRASWEDPVARAAEELSRMVAASPPRPD